MDVAMFTLSKKLVRLFVLSARFRSVRVPGRAVRSDVIASFAQPMSLCLENVDGLGIFNAALRGLIARREAASFSEREA